MYIYNYARIIVQSFFFFFENKRPEAAGTKQKLQI